MYAYYGGVPHVTVPDCLKQGVLKCHLYDPDLNPGYAQLATHYATAIVPARPAHPKDKAICEGLVRILMRYFRFRHRRRTLHLARRDQPCVGRVRRADQRAQALALRYQPSRALRVGGEGGAQGAADGRLRSGRTGKRRRCTPTATCTSRRCITARRISIAIGACGSSSPRTRSRSSCALERIASHPRSRHRDGRRISDPAHFPAKPRPTPRRHRRSSCRSRASSTPSCISSSSSSSTPMSTGTCAAHRAWCVAPTKRSTPRAMSSQANASRAPSPPCAATTRSACRTSRAARPDA